jgi:hypothetical protein
MTSIANHSTQTSFEEIQSVKVILSGILKEADADKGTWRLKSDKDETEYCGGLKGYINIISGLHMGARYLVTCEEVIEVPSAFNESKGFQAIHFSPA